MSALTVHYKQTTVRDDSQLILLPGTFLHIGIEISGTIRLTGMQLSGHLKPGRMHFGFGLHTFLFE